VTRTRTDRYFDGTLGKKLVKIIPFNHPLTLLGRAMVDCVLIDPDYDGKVFRIGLSDIPEWKSDLVAGRCEIPAERCGKLVAVKVIDMLGEEVLETASP
jgi:hypothetical protein